VSVLFVIINYYGKKETHKTFHLKVKIIQSKKYRNAAAKLIINDERLKKETAGNI